MQKKDLKLIEKTLDYQFDNLALLQQAFIRRSYSEENGGENNEVLEFIGDKALDLVVMKQLMKRFGNFTDGEFKEFKTKYQEGKFTEIKKDLVEGKMLAKCIDKLGFHRYLILGKGDQKKNIQEEDSVKEDLFEAIIGAVTIDSNWDLDAIEGVAKLMLDLNDYFSEKRNDGIDYVSEIQKWSQKHQDELPSYEFEETYNGYQCYLSLAGINYFSADAKSKSGARYLAAKKAYEYLDQNNALFSLKDEVGEADYDRAINQLQELFQKGYISEPRYTFKEYIDENGNSIWECECDVEESDTSFANESSSKKSAKKDSAYRMLVYILDRYDPDEEEYDDDDDDYEF